MPKLRAAVEAARLERVAQHLELRIEALKRGLPPMETSADLSELRVERVQTWLQAREYWQEAELSFRHPENRLYAHIRSLFCAGRLNMSPAHGYEQLRLPK